MFFVVNFAEGPPNADGTWKPAFDDHLSTALGGKPKFQIKPDDKLYDDLEKAGFSYPFHGNYCRQKGPWDKAFTKDVSKSDLEKNEIAVQSFVFSLESEEEKTIDEWCAILQDVILPVCRQEDAKRIRRGILKNVPQYADYGPENNLSSDLVDGKYPALDHGILDKGVGIFLEWTAKLADGLLDEENEIIPTVPNSPWLATVFQRHEELRDMFFTDFPERVGYAKTAMVNFGFPFNGTATKAQRTYCKERVDRIIKAFGALTEDDHPQTSGAKFANPLLRSLTTMLVSTVPGNVAKETMIEINSFRVNLHRCDFHLDKTVLANLDSIIAKYNYPFGVHPARGATGGKDPDDEQAFQDLISTNNTKDRRPVTPAEGTEPPPKKSKGNPKRTLNLEDGNV